MPAANKDVQQMAFTTGQVAKLTGFTRRRLERWERTEFFKPTFAVRARSFGRLYSFKDVVSLRTISSLLAKRVSVVELRKVGKFLKEFDDHPWASLRLSVSGRVVHFFDTKLNKWLATKPQGQIIANFDMPEMERDTVARILEFRQRKEADFGEIDRGKRGTRVVVKGTGVKTATISAYRKAGFSVDDILREYPQLTKQDVERALEFERAEKQKAG